MDIHRPQTRRWWLVLPAAILALSFAAPAAVAKDDSKQIADTDIVQAIETEMITDGAVPGHAIYVTSDEGIVTLTGSVDNALARERALRIARTTRGAKAVINRIVVAPVLRSDGQIRSDVIRALSADPATESWEIRTKVNNGTVTLEGTVDSWAEKRLAKQVAAGVRGVREIRNDLVVSHDDERADGEIEADIERRLEMDVWVGDALIDVHVDDGRVRLDGQVGSAFEKTRAASDAWVAGVQSVDDSDLEVTSWLDDRMRRERVANPTDQEIEAAIENAFLYDPRVHPFTPDVDVSYGTVTLTGFVNNLAAKHAAAQDARNVVGVVRVHNYLKVRPPETLTDAALESDVERALRRDPYVHPYDIEVRARNGRVTLTGDVHSNYEKERAATVASRVTGTQEVMNLLDAPPFHDPLAYTTIDPVPDGTPIVKTDAEIEDDIRQQLFWSPFVESDQIQVSVDNGIATLKGTVDDWSERKAARDNAYDGGAIAVIDRLEVDRFQSSL